MPTRKSGYAQVPETDSAGTTLEPLSLLRDEDSLKPCRECGAQKHEIKLLKRERSLTLCILSSFIVLLSLNLAVAALFYLHVRYPAHPHIGLAERPSFGKYLLPPPLTTPDDCGVQSKISHFHSATYPV